MNKMENVRKLKIVEKINEGNWKDEWCSKWQGKYISSASKTKISLYKKLLKKREAKDKFKKN